jgi:two-component system osmolarity sensor histidine kinase EnvZ
MNAPAPPPRFRFRDILPKGLYWRTLLIIVAPAALLQLIITLVFLDDHWQATSKRMSQGVAADIALMIQLYDAPVDIARCNRSGSSLDRYLTRDLEGSIGRNVWYDSTCPGNQVIIRVPTEGGVLQLRAFRDRVQARSGPLFVTWISGATIFLIVVSVIFIRNQVRPIEQLAAAMEQFGRGEDAGHFRVRGAREVRGATHAFFDMRQRIRKHIEQRSQLLAGVSHDLRTPLTRLKLQLALMPPSTEIEDAKRDLAEMEQTLDEYLTFAKGLAEEAPEQVNLATIANEIAIDARRSGADVTIETSGAVETAGRARALKRCLANLIDNAASHGDKVCVRIVGEENFVTA